MSTESFEGYCLSELLYQILFESGQVMGITLSYNKFPRKFIIQKLNNRLNQFVLNSQCIRKTAILLTKKDYGRYKLPENCMDGGIIGSPKFFIDASNYIQLFIRDTQWLDGNYDGWRTGPSATPQYAYMSDSYGNIGLLGVYPKPSVDGTNYAVSPNTGVVVGSTIPVATMDIPGVATGNGTATALGDTTVDFTILGLVAGMSVMNVTDGSTCNIVTVAEHVITTTALSGGSDNLWSVADSYTILAGEYGVITTWGGPDQCIFSSQVGEMTNINVPAGNILLEFIPYPLPFPEVGGDDIYPEIPKLYHMGLAMGVVADLLTTFTEKTKEFERAKVYDKMFWSDVALARNKKKSRPFGDKPVTITPKRSGFRNR